LYASSVLTETSEPAAGFESDESKSLACAANRGFDFEYAARIWAGPVLEREDCRRDYGETRIQALGRIGDRYFVVVDTWRGACRHIISARRAHLKEVLKWAAL
jgi:uncharacterized DUF497 family protein